jgi:hypothetical protein
MSGNNQTATGLHGGVGAGSGLPTKDKHLVGAKTMGALHAAKTVGLSDAVADLNTDRTGAPTVPGPKALPVQDDLYTTSGVLTNPKVA